MWDQFPERPPRWFMRLLIAETALIIPLLILYVYATASSIIWPERLQDGESAFMGLMAAVMLAIPLGQWDVVRRWNQVADRAGQRPAISN